ncbi:hypothetical protein TNCV_1463291 [Trichonephila clavipes]|uniref:Uncharacterized protein n=1 Tax=Trichonephila clavipes TaxID=2585209 RepID=A0A8X6SBJ2_TRICX|nr:hypothetical protein TNCV_1463291 [Trichonephila clavipes]
MARRNHLDDFTRGRMIGKLEERRTVTSVAAEFGINRYIILVVDAPAYLKYDYRYLDPMLSQQDGELPLFQAEMVPCFDGCHRRIGIFT